MNRKNAVWAAISGILFAVAGLWISYAESLSQGTRPLGLTDILAWNSIQSAVVSNNGEWFAYYLVPNKGNREIVIRKTKGEQEFRFPVGEFPRSFFRGGMIIVSEDSNWVAFTVYPDAEKVKKLKKENKRISSSVALVNLLTGERREFGDVKTFTFSRGQSSWLILHSYLPESGVKDKGNGSDLILYELASKNELNIGNVSEFAIDKSGTLLAWCIDALEKRGNGVQLRNMDSGKTLVLDSDQAFYKGLTWAGKGDALAVLKGIGNKSEEAKLWDVLGFTNLFQETPIKVVYQPSKDSSFPQGMSVSPDRNPTWTEDLSALFFGMRQGMKNDRSQIPSGQDESAISGRNEEESTDLVIWHWLDGRDQSLQQFEEAEDRAFSYLCVYRVKEKKFVRLADEALRDVIPAPKNRWAIGFDEREYQLTCSLSGHCYRDIYIVDLRTGARRLAVKKCRQRNPFSTNEGYWGTSPDGEYFLYYNDGHFFTYEITTDRSYDVSENIPTSFINAEEATNIPDEPNWPVGWVKGSKSILLYDGWDVWKADVHGETWINLTAHGKEEGIHYGDDYAPSFRANRFVLDPDEEGIDLSHPVYFGAYGEWTKKGGIAYVKPEKPGAGMLLWGDALFKHLIKAKNSNIFLYTKETHQNSPDYYVTDGTFQKSLKITNANPQQKDIVWSGGSKLIDYQSTKGHKLQAALFLPANYEEGKRYPTIVHIYERLSQTLNRYPFPNVHDFPVPYYTSRGYAVLMPDIVYKVDDPAMSAVWCVIPAIEASIATGIVDKKRLGLYGHSWGGYQTAFLITQTDIFMAAVAGAPLTNVISLYNLIYGYGGRGYPQHMLFESGQSRFSQGYWENMDAFVRNSPVLFADKVKTPLLLMHNDRDNAVDWNQGIEYFNALRRLQKPVIMLQYRGEDHSPQKLSSQIDYLIRMSEFFDYYLMGKAAPSWISEGVPYLKIKDYLKEESSETEH